MIKFDFDFQLWIVRDIFQLANFFSHAEKNTEQIRRIVKYLARNSRKSQEEDKKKSSFMWFHSAIETSNCEQSILSYQKFMK